MTQHRLPLIVIGAILFGLMGLLWSTSEGPEEPALSIPHTPSRIPSVETGQLPKVSASRVQALAGTPLEEQGQETPGATNSEEAPPFTSTLFGRIFNALDEPIPHGRVCVESLTDPTQRTVSKKSNSLGEYELKLSAGRWAVYFTGAPRDGGFGYTFIDNISIEEDEVRPFDLHLHGDRAFAGGFIGVDDQSIVLALELYLSHDRSFVFAKGECLPDPEQYKRHLEREKHHRELAESRGEVPKKPKALPPGRGVFYVGGLPPEVYEMRLYLDLGKRFYVSATVDLTLGDKILQPIELTNLDFFTHRVLEL